MTAPHAALAPMAETALARWRLACEDAGTPFPAADDGTTPEAFEILLDEVTVGGAVLTFAREAGRPRATIRLMQTTLADDDAPRWAAVLAAVEAHVRGRGVQTLTTAIPPHLAPPFTAAGFEATMTGVGLTHPSDTRITADDGRVRVRPMDAEERARFVADAAGFIRADMERYGVLTAPGASMGEVDRRLSGLVIDPPPEELLFTAVVDGTPVGRFWGTLVPGEDSVGMIGNTIDLFPEHRGKGLTRPFMAALETYVVEHGLREIHGRVYGHSSDARSTLRSMGVGVQDVHLRKDLHPWG